MYVAVAATGAAGVKDSLFISGNSRLFRRRGELLRPDGEVGFDDCGETCTGREGMGRRRLAAREEVMVDCAEEGCELEPAALRSPF